MFTSGDLKKEKIDEQDFISFNSNTIVYDLIAGSERSDNSLKTKNWSCMDPHNLFR